MGKVGVRSPELSSDRLTEKSNIFPTPAKGSRPTVPPPSHSEGDNSAPTPSLQPSVLIPTPQTNSSSVTETDPVNLSHREGEFAQRSSNPPRQIEPNPSTPTTSTQAPTAPTLEPTPKHPISSKPNLPTHSSSDQLRKSSRVSKPPDRFQDYSLYSHFYYRMSLASALEQPTRKESILKSIETEIHNLDNPKVMSPVNLNNIANRHKPDIITLWLFHKEKFKPNGAFDKDKCRIVTLSQHRDPNSIGETFAPTVKLASVFTILQFVATQPHYLISSYDVKSAFLKTSVPDYTFIYVKAPPELVKWWTRFIPTRTSDISSDGCIYFRLKSYLYGLHEAPYEFNSMINIDLIKHGFIRLKADQCIYIKSTSYGLLIVTLHVDDMLVANPSSEIKRWFEETFMEKYELTGEHNDFSYIGMSISRNKEEIKVNQLGYIDNMVIKYLPKQPLNFPSVPASASILKKKSSSSPVSSTKYLSIVMTLMYLARHTRPDILMPVTFLATKSASPTAEYYSDAIRIIAYVHNTRSITMRFSHSASMEPSIYADASHLLHQDARGHGGIILSLGSAPIMTKSYKLKLNTKSSTESELVVLEAATSYAKWWTLLLSELNLPNISYKSIIIHQDNLSAIAMVKNSQFDNLNKHMVNRVEIIKEELKTNTISIKYCPTDRMIADILTKICDKITIKNLLLFMNFLIQEDRPR
jgi:hypothetical protein